MLSSQNVVNKTIKNFIVYGDNYNFTNYILLSSNTPSLIPNITSVNTAKMGTVSGTPLSTDKYTILNNNTISFYIPTLSGTGDLDVIVTNPAGYASVKKSLGFSLIVNWLFHGLDK